PAQSPSSSAPAASSASPLVAPGAKVNLTGAGSTFDFPLFSKVFDAYQQQTGVQVNYQSIGSGGGIEQFTKKTVDFGASDGPLNDDQTKAATDAGGPPLHIPVTLGAVAVGYNLPGVDNLQLDGDTLSAIFLGTITKWNDPKIAALNPNAKLPPTAVAVVHRSDGSGTTFIFTDYLGAVSTDWKSKVGTATSVSWPTGIGGQGSEGVAGQVKQTPGAIGYFELAYAKQNNIATAAMKNAGGKFVQPSVAAATAAAAGAAANMPADLKARFPNAPGDATYPITGFSWIIVFQNQPDAAKGRALVDLLNYVVTKGQAFSEPLFYAPLPDPVVALDQKAIKTITVAGQSQQ
ncbi:MAG TPA: phosphate ABC transporter substrate-binding protein PstS, partial [Chloroflexota bacterium]|nr:phosphate ABC transporter substrate-binding protein PstS [Chloroflexota bacterium]